MLTTTGRATRARTRMIIDPSEMKVPNGDDNSTRQTGKPAPDTMSMTMPEPVTRKLRRQREPIRFLINESASH